MQVWLRCCHSTFLCFSTCLCSWRCCDGVHSVTDAYYTFVLKLLPVLLAPSSSSLYYYKITLPSWSHYCFSNMPLPSNIRNGENNTDDWGNSEYYRVVDCQIYKVQSAKNVLVFCILIDKAQTKRANLTCVQYNLRV